MENPFKKFHLDNFILSATIVLGVVGLVGFIFGLGIIWILTQIGFWI